MTILTYSTIESLTHLVCVCVSDGGADNVMVVVLICGTLRASFDLICPASNGFIA